MEAKRPIFRSQDVSRNPGVYVFRNSVGEVIYVGKARNLRNRMRSYFMPSTVLREEPRRRALIHSIASYETFEVSTEAEALLLEERFIKQYSPRYNVALRDDKRYLLICTDPSEQYPRFWFERMRKEDGRLYFGPYPHANALRDTVRHIEITLKLRSCQCAVPDMETHLHCLEEITRECSAPCIGKCTPEEYRSRYEQAIQILRGEEPAHALMAEVHGKMESAAQALDFEAAAKWRDIYDSVKMTLEPARRFINQTIARRTAPTANEAGMAALQQALGLSVKPAYMECFDMSNISGTLAVGSMVLFRDGHPSTSEYRRYRIRNQEATDDTAFMREVLTRRYSRLLKAKAPLPDLVVVDGGRPQVNVAQEVFQDLGIAGQVPFIGLAKQYELVVIPQHQEELMLERENPGLRLLQAIRDEAHRWANGYNRTLRLARIHDSVLDRIDGIGKVRREQLLRNVGSVQRIMQCTPEELASKVPGLGVKTAMVVLAQLKKAQNN